MVRRIKQSVKNTVKLISFITNRQVLAQYNVAQSNTTKSYLVNSSAKVYSQDFQTVFANKDVFGYNQVNI